MQLGRTIKKLGWQDAKRDESMNGKTTGGKRLSYDNPVCFIMMQTPVSVIGLGYLLFGNSNECKQGVIQYIEIIGVDAFAYECAAAVMQDLANS